MVMQCYNVNVGDDDNGDPIYLERCYDDGENQTWQQYLDAGVGDADLAGGLLTPEALAAVIGKDNVDYTGWMKEAMTPEAQAAVQKLIASRADPSLIGKVLNGFKNADGSYNWAAIATAGTGLYSMLKNKDEGGYNVPVPKMDAVRQQVAYDDTNRRPGFAGRQYLTDPRFVKQGDAASMTAAQDIAAGQAAGLLAAYKTAGAPSAVNPWAGKLQPEWNPAAPTVNELYQNVLGRAPEAGMADYWNNKFGTTINPQEASQFKSMAQPELDKRAAAALPVSSNAAATGIASALPVIPTQEQLMTPNYKIGMASGGIANARYLQGGTDGMADKIPAAIDNEQPAALSHGEFVIPADVVSHLGNGNSEAGADKLYQMMARIRKARTGNEKQGKKINPDKFMPGGLAAAYAAGGSVKHYDGNTGSVVSTTTTPSTGVPLDTSKTSTLSPWAGDYITNFLGQGAALANAPMQVYGGPLTAGASDLQQQGFAGMSDIAGAGYQPGSFTNQYKAPAAYSPTTSSFDTAAASQYMNPYLTSALQPQIDEARRQSQITQQQNAAKMTQAGAFGGSRQAIMDAETQRSLGANLANITGTGYNTAYEKATQQFNADQARKMAEAQFGAGQGMTAAQNAAQYGQSAQAANEASRQYSSEFGLKSLQDLMSAGATQRAIEGEGIAADKAQFEQQQAYPFNMVEFQRKLVEGLPTGASTTATNQDTISKLQTDIAGLASLYKTLANLGVKT